jgi:hypothetical protein
MKAPSYRHRRTAKSRPDGPVFAGSDELEQLGVAGFRALRLGEVRTNDYRQQPQPAKRQQVPWRTGLLYVRFGLSPYVSYSTSFEPNLQTNRAPGVGPFDRPPVSRPKSA